MLKIVVFVSGRGSNLKAIEEAFRDQPELVKICAVVSNKSDCPAFEFASSLSINTYTVSANGGEESITYDKLVEELKSLGINLIVLAGFLKKLPAILINSYKQKIINIHPALLPAFGGKGMYGMNVHTAVFNKSVMVSGPTVHFVDEVYDNGKIIAQRTADISDAESPEEIAKRVLKLEHELLPYVIRKFAENKVEIRNNRVYLSN